MKKISIKKQRLCVNFPQVPKIVINPSLSKKDTRVGMGRFADLVASQVASQVTSQIAAQEKRTEKYSYRLVLMPRDKAQKKAARKGLDCIILGSSDLTPFEIQSKILRYTTLPKVKGLEQLGSISAPSSISGGGAVVSVRTHRAARMDNPGGSNDDSGGSMSYRYPAKRHSSSKSKITSIQYNWVLERITTTRDNVSGTVTREHVTKAQRTELFYDFKFVKSDFQMTDYYKHHWMFPSSKNHFHFTCQDAMDVRDFLCNEDVNQSQICSWILDYFSRNNAKIRMLDDVVEFLDAITYIMFHIYDTHFNDSDEAFGRYAREQFQTLSYNDFHDSDRFLSHWHNAFSFCMAQIGPQPISTSPVFELPSVASTTEQKYCTYIVPGKDRSREEIEANLREKAQQSAASLREFLHNYRILGYLDFRHESPSQIYDTLNARYQLPYSKGNFIRDWID